MKLVSLLTAIREIRQACDNSVGTFRPFFFVVGAGLSAPPIPLAGEIIDHCKKKAVEDGVPADTAPKDALDQYSHWFDSAYPHPSDRREYLRRLIQDRPISHANLRLAHILESGNVARMVITPNFDDQLARSLSLFGKEFVICDHPQTAPRIDPERSDVIQIVHVHGSYWFYDCCNLKDEIVDRSHNSPLTTVTMASLLDRILARRAPLVVGYSGWEHDVIMSALRRALDGQHLPYRMYWFCYRETDADNAPDWLRKHPEVRFVVSNGDDEVRSPNSLKHPVGQETVSTRAGTSDNCLTAESVMDEFIRSFKMAAPKLTSDPMAFYADHLRRSIFHADDTERQDLYGIADVISRLQRGRDLELTKREANDIALERVRDALRRSAYAEVLRQAISIGASHLSSRQSEDLQQAMDGSINASWNNLLAASVYGPACDLLLSLAERSDTNLEKRHARVTDALYRKATHLLFTKKDPAAAIRIAEDLTKRYEADDARKRNWGLAQLTLGNAFRAQAKSAEAVDRYDVVIREFSPESRNGRGRDLVGWAAEQKAEILRDLKQFESALAVVATGEEVLRNTSGDLTAITSRLRLLKSDIVNKWNQEKALAKAAAAATSAESPNAAS